MFRIIWVIWLSSESLVDGLVDNTLGLESEVRFPIWAKTCLSQHPRPSTHRVTFSMVRVCADHLSPKEMLSQRLGSSIYASLGCSVLETQYYSRSSQFYFCSVFSWLSTNRWWSVCRFKATHQNIQYTGVVSRLLHSAVTTGYCLLNININHKVIYFTVGKLLIVKWPMNQVFFGDDKLPEGETV